MTTKENQELQPYPPTHYSFKIFKQTKNFFSIFLLKLSSSHLRKKQIVIVFKTFQILFHKPIQM